MQVVYLLHEYALGVKSKWFAYTSLIPELHVLEHIGQSWEESHACFQGSLMYRRIPQWVKTLKEDATMIRNVLAEANYKWPTNDALYFTDKELMRMRLFVSSRAFGTRESGETSLIPLIELVALKVA